MMFLPSNIYFIRVFTLFDQYTYEFLSPFLYLVYKMSILNKANYLNFYGVIA